MVRHLGALARGFLILSREGGIPPLKEDTLYITSLMFTVRNIPAALYKALGGFATNGINMVKLESYMGSGVPKGSSFHLDLEGHPDDRMMQYASAGNCDMPWEM